VPVPDGFEDCQALLDFSGAARDLVAHIKYRNQRAALDWLAAGMAALVAESTMRHACPIEVVTWAPTSDRRRRQRGFDHAQLLARRIARRLDVPARDLLRHGQ